MNRIVRRWAGSAALALPFLLANPVVAGGKPEKIEFSDPATPATFSNLSRLAPDKSFSDQIKEDLFKPFDSMKQGSSLDPVMPEFPPPRQPQQMTPDRRQRELMDQRKNWAFVDPADLLPNASLDDTLQLKQYGPDGREKKDPTAIEKYYEKLGKRQGPTAVEMSLLPGAGRNRDFAGTNAFNSARFSYSTNESLWAAPSSEAESSLPPWAAAGTSTAAEKLKEKQHRSDFESLLNGRLSAPTSTPSPFAVPTSPVAGFDVSTVLATFAATPDSKPAKPQAPPVEYHNPASPQLGAAPADALMTRPHALDDPTLRALGLPQPPIKLAETPKPTAPVMERAVEFSLPQRKF